MKIKSPTVSIDETRILCDLGVDEFFCGIEPYYWRKKYKNFCINQRSTKCNFTKLTDLKRSISIVHKYKAKVHVAINAFFYLEQQYDIAERVVKDVLDIGADGLILADAALLLKLDKDLLKDKDIVIGCDGTVFNNAAVKFYKDLGATRIVFDRAMTLFEMREVISLDSSLEYEVFIIHDLCFFVDGFCTYCKTQLTQEQRLQREASGTRNTYLFTSQSIPTISNHLKPTGCRANYRQYRMSVTNHKRIGYTKSFSFWNKKHIEGCGACAIYDLNEMGIASLKVLDRQKPTSEKAKATSFIKKSKDLLSDKNISRIDYIEKCKELFKKTFKAKCNHYDCYYPSVFLEKSE